MNRPSLNLRNFDVLRGLLIIYILFSHSIWLLVKNPTKATTYYHPVLDSMRIHFFNFFTCAASAAFMFFVISGFFIHLRCAQQLACDNSFKFSIRAFFKSRCQRMLPPYYFALLLTVVMDSVGRYWHPSLYCARTTDAYLNAQFSIMQYSLSSIIPAVLLLPGSLGLHFGTNGVLWFFSFLINFYLLYPLWIGLRRLGAVPAYTAGITIAIVAYFLSPDFLLRAPMMLYPCWLAGAAIAEIACKVILSWRHAGVGLIITILGFLGMRFLRTSFFSDPLQILFHGLCASGLIITAVSLPININKYKLLQIIEIAGKESYTIFLCHFPLLVFIAAWVFEVYKERIPGVWLFILGTGLTVYVCHLCFLFCERYFQTRRVTD